MNFKNKKKEKWNRKLNDYAGRLNRKPPASEIWFWKEWRGVGMNFRDEVRNAVFAQTIPDVRSKRFKYIIEIDGKVHAKPEVRAKDDRKTALWNREGYRVYRIMAGDQERLLEVARKVRAVRNESPPLSDSLRRIFEI